METLQNITPLLMWAGLASFMFVEKRHPYFEHSASRGRQRRRNLIIVVITGLVALATTSLATTVISWSGANRFGQTYGPFGQSLLFLVLGIFVIDLVSYSLHITFHKVPACWR